MKTLSYHPLLFFFTVSNGIFYLHGASLPIVINTWPFVNATEAAWKALNSGHSTEDSLVIGCTKCEVLQCDGSVGYGGSPDETGETTLDAMIMKGETFDVGAVGDLRRVKNAIGVAQAVMHYSSHTLLAGESATKFAVEMGFKEESLTTNKSRQMYKDWKAGNCQPNYRIDVTPNPHNHCGPYSPMGNMCSLGSKGRGAHPAVDQNNHDTIGMVIIDDKSHVFAGTTTNGMNHKVPGRVGDSPIMGAGAYASDNAGGAAATGDGDIMMRFLPSYRAVLEMENGASPHEAAKKAMLPIVKYYPKFSGALIAVNLKGDYGAYCHGFSWFKMSVASPVTGGVKVVSVLCDQS